MTDRKPDSEKQSIIQNQGTSNLVEKDWEERLRSFFDENRLLSFILLGGLTFTFGIMIDPDVALVVVTALLYLAIVFVNVELKELQRGQKSILERERRPLVEVAGVDFSSDPCKVRVSNFGQGYATFLSLALKIHIPVQTDIESKTTWVNLTRANDEEFERFETTIPSNQENILFEGNPKIGFSEKENHRETSVKEATEKFVEEDVGRVNYRVVLVYSNQLGEIGWRNLSEIRSVYVEEPMKFQEIHEQSFILGGYERDTFPDFSLNDIIHTRDVDQLREPGPI